jgi:hypothetical protein
LIVAQNRDQQSNVVGGTIEPDYQFPWVVNVSGTLTGKGVLIAPTWVLTAAHNVETSFGGARVSYTRTDPNTGRATSGSQTTAAGSVLLHPDYVTGNPNFDLALVRLPAAFAPDPFLQTAALPTAAAAVGQSGTIASISHTATLPPGHVAVLRAPVLLIGGTTFIARSPTASLCPGDSGSGFIASNGDVNVVVGIASQAAVGDCTKPNIEFTAVDVFKHLAWIRSTLGIFNSEFYATDGSGGIARLRGHSNWRDSWHSIVPGNFGGDGHTDLLFYDRNAGDGEFYTTDGSGGITLLKAQPNWRTSWDLIVPGNFGGGGSTDLLFYDRETGTGQFYATEGGAIHELRTHTNWRTSWDLIVPGDFGGDGHTDLLFYDRRAGDGEFYTTDGSGGIRLLRSQTGWRTSWDMIVPGAFGGDGRTDLLFYDRAARQGAFYKTDGLGGIAELKTYDGWRDTWNVIIAGNFADGSASDLLFYDRTAGWGEFYRNRGEASLTQLRGVAGWRTTWSQLIPGDFGGNGWTDLLFYERPV